MQTHESGDTTPPPKLLDCTWSQDFYNNTENLNQAAFQVIVVSDFFLTPMCFY